MNNKMKDKKSRTEIFIILFIIIATSFAIYKYQNRPFEINDYTQVSIEDFEERVTATGIITAEKYIALSPKLSARILSLPFREGDLVTANQVIARLDDSNNNREVSNKRASVNVSRANMESLNTSRQLAVENIDKLNIQLDRIIKDVERKKELYEAGAIPKVELEQEEQKQLEKEKEIASAKITLASYDSSGTETKKAIQNLEQAKTQLSGVQAAAEDYIIKSPATGVITVINQKEGELAALNTPLAEIAVGQKVAEAEIDEKNIAKVFLGQAVRIYLPGQEQNYIDGIVSFLSPKVDKEKGTLKIRCSVDETKQNSFLYESEITLSFLVKRYEKVQVLDSKYLFSDGEKTYIFLNRDNQAEKVEVKTQGFGPKIIVESPDMKEKQILSPEGLKDGQKIVLKPKGGK